MPDSTFWLIVAAGAVFVLLVTLSLKNLAREKPRQAFESGVPEEDSPDYRCLACGDPASEPLPSIERGRGAHDWLRELFAMPPRYKRVVRGDYPSLCRSHAHVADAMVDEFLHNRVRGAFTAAYTKVAVEAAGFEKEFLTKQLSESLTEAQQREQRKRAQGGTVTRLVAGAGASSTREP